MQMHTAEFLRKYIAEKQQYLEKYLEDSFVNTELNKLTFQKLTVEELQPAVEDFKTLLMLLPRPKNPTSNLSPTPQIFTDVDMTQDDPAAVQATSSSSSSASSSATSSTKPLKTPQSNSQPTKSPSLEMKIETLTALVLKATKSIAILKQEFPDGPPTADQTNPGSNKLLLLLLQLLLPSQHRMHTILPCQCLFTNICLPLLLVTTICNNLCNCNTSNCNCSTSTINNRQPTSTPRSTPTT
jgi:hypothetical protein